MEGRRRRSSLLACAAVGGLLAVGGCVGSEPERLVLGTDVDSIRVAESAEIRIELFDDLDTPVPGAVVRLSTDTPGTVLSADEVVTGPAGAARVTLTAASRVGENRVEAVHGDLSASLVVPGVAGPPASFAVTAAPARTVNGSTVAVAVAVTDRFDNPVPDVPVGLEAAPDVAALDRAGRRDRRRGVADPDVHHRPRARRQPRAGHGGGSAAADPRRVPRGGWPGWRCGRNGRSWWPATP